MDFIKIIIKPKSVFEQIKEQSSWGQTFIILSFFSIIIAFFFNPITKQLTNSMIESTSLSNRELIESTQEKLKYWGLIFEPFNLAVKILTFCVLTYLGVLIFKGKSNFKQLFSLCTNAFFILLISNAVNLVFLYLNGIEKINNVFDLSAIGLNLLFEKKPNYLYLFLSNINIFQIWFVCIMILGISNLAEINTKKSMLIVILTWLIIAYGNTTIMLMSYK